MPAWPVRVPGARALGGLGRRLHGLFVGGTLCSEAGSSPRSCWGPTAGHTFTDFGDDAYTAGRAHPMIDPTLRLEQLAAVAGRRRTGVLLLDVVLGHGAEPDPAALLAPAVAQVPQPVVVSSSAPPTTRRTATARPRSSPGPAPRSTCPTPAPRAVRSAPREVARDGHAHCRRHRRHRPARRRRRVPGRAGDPRRLAPADGRHRGRPRRGGHRPAARRRQRARAGGDARRPGHAGRRRPGRGAARAGARRVPARGSADRLGPRSRTAARRPDGRRRARGPGRRPRGRRRAVRVRLLGLARALPPPRCRRTDGRGGHPVDVDVGAGGRPHRSAYVLLAQRGPRQGAALRRLRARGARAAALDERGARPAARRPAVRVGRARSTSPAS